MKLVALWVEDYMKFKDQTFNLDHSREFVFNFDKVNRVLNISSKEKENYVSLFDKPYVGVTAIVGKNAAGKSTFLKMINVINNLKPLEKPMVLIFQDLTETKQPFYEIFLYQHLGFAFDTIDKRAVYKINTDTDEYLESLKKSGRLFINTKNESNPFLKVDVLNFNNVFNHENDKYLKSSDPLNRNTTYQILLMLSKKLLKDYISEFEKKDGESSQFFEESFNPLNLYFEEKLERRISFLAKVHTDKKFPSHLIEKINLPKSIDIWFDYSIFQLLEEKIKDHKFYPKLKNRNLQWLEGINTEKDGVKAFKNRVLLQVINSALYNDLIFKKENSEVLEPFKSFIEEMQEYEKIEFQILNSFMKEKLIDSEVFIVNQYNILLDKLNNLVNDLQISQDYISLAGMAPMYKVEINDKTWKLLEPLITANYYGDYSFFHYQFTNLSSGEDALLNQYTEIYNGLQANSREFLMLLIDEGDLYLHPEWQREYLSSIIEFLSFSVRKGVKIQLIFTSHSPFILSDLTKHQVLFFNHNNDEYRMGISINQKDQIETFGANIYDLFKDSFFMEKGFIGEFAKQKIDKVFDDLNGHKKEITKKRKAEIKQIISVIGEPLIKRQLSKMYDDLYNTDLEVKAINEQIERLEKIRDKKTKG